MKVFAISDLHLSTNTNKPMDIFGSSWNNYIEEILHSWNENVGENDIVLICGDISWAMKLEDAREDIDFLAGLKGKKILVRGNHDYWWNSITKVRNLLEGKNIFALQNDALFLENVVFCGTRGWIVPDGDNLSKEDRKIYEREIIRMEMALCEATKMRSENQELIVLTHFPPFNVRRDDSKMTNLFVKYNANAVVYGHLHGKNSRSDVFLTKAGVKYYLTSCDQVENRLVRII